MAKYYYYPGWHEPGTPGECTINKKAFERLPADLQAIVTSACQAMNTDLYAEYTAKSYPALQALMDERQVQLRRFPDDVLRALREQSADARAEIGSRDAATKKVYLAYEKFLRQVAGWTEISEYSFLKART